MSTQTPPVTATNWFEVYSKDIQATKDFYTSVFGWTAESMPMGPDQEYFMLSNNGGVFAGIMDLNSPGMEHVPPHWGLYLHTENCQATLDKATALGATVVYGPMDIPDIGTVAGITDPCGAHFNIHQPAKERGILETSPVNWIEHMSSNRAGAVDFYKALFGWGSMDMEMGDPVGTYSMFTIGETPIAGCMQIGADQGHPCWLMYHHSDNLEATCEKISTAGGQVMNPAMDIGEFGRIAIVADSTGAVFGLHEPKMGG